MKNNYTFQILKYIYKELSLTDYLETEYAINQDKKWKMEYNKIKKAFDALPKVTFFPKKNVLREIMEYSASRAA